MRLPDALDLVNDVEQRLPVMEWTADGVRIWPLVRMAVATSLVDLYIDITEHATPDSRRPRARQLREAASTLMRPMLASLRDRSHRAPRRGKSDVVLLGDGLSKVWLDDAWHDRLCDPFSEALAARGLTSLQLDPARQPLVPRRYPSRVIQPVIEAARIRSRSATPESESLTLPGHDKMLETVARENPRAAPMTAAVVARRAGHLRLLARWYERLLTEHKARMAFVVDYSVHSMAFNLACTRLGIDAVEIQHGAQGPLNWWYSRWAAVPEGGYELLPGAYWVWSAVEAEVIEPWAAAAFPRHRVVAGGNLWLDLWRDGTSELVRRYDRRVRAARDDAPGERHVLLALATGHNTDALLQPFVDAIRARPTWRWWVRAHPGMEAAETARAKQRLSAVPGAQLELEASELPLYAILRHLDATASTSSGVVVEAALMGVPSIVADVDVATHFGREIESGWVAVAPTDVAGALDRQIERAPGLARYAPPRSTPEDALDMLLPPDLSRREQRTGGTDAAGR